MNEDVVLPGKDKDGELRSSFPEEISEVGDYMESVLAKKNGELMDKLRDKFDGEIQSKH